MYSETDRAGSAPVRETLASTLESRLARLNSRLTSINDVLAGVGESAFGSVAEMPAGDRRVQEVRTGQFGAIFDRIDLLERAVDQIENTASRFHQLA